MTALRGHGHAARAPRELTLPPHRPVRQCLQELETHLFEELEPLAVLAKRGTAAAEGMGPLEYLVQWSDGSENTWEARATFRTGMLPLRDS